MSGCRIDPTDGRGVLNRGAGNGLVWHLVSGCCFVSADAVMGDAGYGSVCEVFAGKTGGFVKHRFYICHFAFAERRA